MKGNELFFPWANDSNSSRAKVFLLLLITGDFVFMSLHILNVANVLDNPLLSLSVEFGYPEIFQYLKETWIAILLFSAFAKTRAIGFIVWGILFVYLLLDDALKIHETLGRHLAEKFDFPFTLGLPAKVFGQLLVSATAGAVFLLSLVVSYVRSSVAFKQATKHLLLLLVALACFGILADMLNNDALNRWRHSGTVMTFVEESGEMVVMSLIAWYVLVLRILGRPIGKASDSPL